MTSDCFYYTFAAHEDEADLCVLEQRRLFGAEAGAEGLLSKADIDPSRSPFIKAKLRIIYEAEALEQLAAQVASLPLGGCTFKVVCVKNGLLTYEEMRAAERLLGAHIHGTADMRQPQRLLGAARLTGGRWIFGDLQLNKAVWLEHNAKPRHYSTALGTRVARAAVNIAVPRPEGVKAVDPCCGIGTVIIEALSMGMDIEGFDLNPLVVQGARANLKHFGYPDVVKTMDMRRLDGHYDAAVLDLPYNLCSILPPEELREMLVSIRRIADLAVVVTTEDIDAPIVDAGFVITDRCSVRKGAFVRYLLVCE